MWRRNIQAANILAGASLAEKTSDLLVNRRHLSWPKRKTSWERLAGIRIRLLVRFPALAITEENWPRPNKDNNGVGERGWGWGPRETGDHPLLASKPIRTDFSISLQTTIPSHAPLNLLVLNGLFERLTCGHLDADAFRAGLDFEGQFDHHMVWHVKATEHISISLGPRTTFKGDDR